MSHQLLTAFLTQPLLVEPRFGAMLTAILARKVSGTTFSGADLHAELGIAVPGARSNGTVNRIAVIPVVGIVSQRPQSMGASTNEIGAQFRAALQSKHVDAILFDVDSPGGTVTGVPELAAEIHGARGVKPMAAIANGQAASAAYWLASATGDVWVTPSGEAGSIGVYSVHEDWSAALEKEGVKVTASAAGKYKIEGAPWLPLTEEAQAVTQARVDEVYGWFVKAVATHRRTTQEAVRNGYGEGRVLGAKQALAADLVDRVGTFDDVVSRLARKIGMTTKTKAELERERLQLRQADAAIA